jgi:hypothetical protein
MKELIVSKMKLLVKMNLFSICILKKTSLNVHASTNEYDFCQNLNTIKNR